MKGSIFRAKFIHVIYTAILFTSFFFGIVLLDTVVDRNISIYIRDALSHLFIVVIILEVIYFLPGKPAEWGLNLRNWQRGLILGVISGLAVGISDTFERLKYLIRKYEVLIYRGPFLEMALMAYNQIKEIKKSSRGLFFDCLHSIYFLYIDFFITNDEHFQMLKDNIEHFNYLKIYHLNELQLKTYIRRL